MQPPEPVSTFSMDDANGDYSPSIHYYCQTFLAFATIFERLSFDQALLV